MEVIAVSSRKYLNLVMVIADNLSFEAPENASNANDLRHESGLQGWISAVLLF
jgi:hypothetical protein